MSDFYVECCRDYVCKASVQQQRRDNFEFAQKAGLDPRELLGLFPDLYPSSLPLSGYIPKYCTKELLLKVCTGKKATDIDSIAAAQFTAKKALKLQGRLGDETCAEDAVGQARLHMLKILENRRLRCDTLQEQYLVDTAIFTYLQP